MPMVAVNETPRTLEIVESTYRPTTCGKGMVLRCLAQEVTGANEGRLAYLDFTLEHEDEAIQQAGQRAFAALRRAVDVMNPADSEELHWKAFSYPIGGVAVEYRRAA